MTATQRCSEAEHTREMEPAARPALRFADVCAMLPPAPPLGDALAGPAWAASWADAIVCFWETERALGTLDADRPLYLLDVTPGCGTLAWLLVEALDARLPASGVAGLDWRYLLCEAERDDREADLRVHRAVHPRFASLIDSGRVGVASWSLSGNGVLLRDGGAIAPAARDLIERFANPVVAVATGWFARQPAHLYAAHYGRWLEAEVDVRADDSGYALTYRWQTVTPDAHADASDDPWQPLIERYTTNLVSACVLLPTGAMSLVDALRRVSGERYLLLACDMGVADEAALRDGALSVPDTYRAGDTIAPVNFHALAWRQRSACAIQRETGADGLVVQAIWSRAGDDVPATAHCALADLIERCEPWDARRLAQTVEQLAEEAPLDTLLTLLRASADDPAVLGAVLSRWSALATQLSAAPERVKQAWRAALERTWRHYLPDARTAQFDAQLASAAATLGAWGLAKEVWRSVLACDEREAANQDHARWRACVHLHLAHCLASTGALPEARAQIAQALALDCDDPDVHAWQTELDARASHRHALPWYRADLARDAALAIEPLGFEHADALLDAYADPHIAEFANLPSLSDLQQVRDWLDSDAAEAGRTSYAVVESQRGFVGVVSLCRAGNAAHFYFWIDARAQGEGFGTRAARLLFEQARAAGIAEIFTASYAANARSHDALQRLGFNVLPVRSADDPDVRFFHLRIAPSAVDAGCVGYAGIEDVIARFSALSAAIDSPVDLVWPTAPAFENALASEEAR